MKLLNKIALGVMLASTTATVSAGNFQSVTSEAVGVEAATTGVLTADIAGAAIVLEPATAYAANDRLFITLTNGAKFADSTYRLEQSTGGAANGDLTEFVLVTPTTAGATSLEFKAASAIDATDEFILTGSTAAGQVVTFTVPSLAAGGEVDIDAYALDVIGQFDPYTSIELFQYANELSATIDSVADAVVDVNDGRLTFTGGASTDSVGIDFASAGLTNGLTLNDDDKVNITLSGNMADIASIAVSTAGTARGNMTIDYDANTATFSASASDAFAGTGSAVLTITASDTSPLATRSFTVQADANFESETDKNLVAEGTAIGSWTINGMQAKVSQLSLNASGS
jgi:hypothetical protein